MRPRTPHAATMLLTFSIAGSAIGSPSFHPVGTLGAEPDGFEFSRITSISADGTVAGGWSNSPDGQRAVRWTLGGGLTPLDSLPGGGFHDSVSAISPDGATMFGAATGGASTPGSMGEATRWSAGSPSGLGFIAPSTFDQSGINDASADGTTLVGLSSSDTAFEFEAARWVGGVAQALGTGSGSSATGVSADGSVIVGSMPSTTGAFFGGFVWTESGITELQDLASTPPFDTGSTALAVSDDGATIVGWATDFFNQQAVRWDTGGNVSPLGALVGFDSSLANDVSPDGSIIVGEASDTFSGAQAAFMWTESSGMINLDTLLHDLLGSSLDGWTIQTADAISDDGLTFSGLAMSPEGVFQGYVATIPAPGVLLPLGLAACIPTRRRANTKER